ncbi:MAG: ACP S-malonyltransferase [Gemmatimonadetes bacterium]|nr:ACP S-malonyltransferase [Gemmatimonadota bacterium]MDA1103812.1 ACP S-malonyltransferase [Gemmatimonadota bacterium]
MPLALIFPGQGSQHVGMATALAEVEPVAAEVLRVADEVLGFSLSRLMREGPEDDLTATKNAQPALLTHSVAVLRTVRSRIGPASFAAGHSLGEFSAHVAAGTLSFEDALGAVRIRGELMFETGRERAGTMAAILGLEDEVVEELCARVQDGVCVPANFNSAGQVVVSGDLVGIEHAMRLAHEAGAKKVVRLTVSGAFHSPLMAPAAEGLRAHLESVDFRDPDYPVISNATADPVTKGDVARELLVRQLTSPVRWSASISTMIEAGADRFLELGPGRVLSTLNRRNAKGFPSTALGEPADLESLEVTS